MFKEKNIKKNKFFSKNTCKIEEVYQNLIEVEKSGTKWGEI